MKKNKKGIMTNKTLFILLISTILLSCGGKTFTPKPAGYFRVDLPIKEYQTLEKDCPFTFEFPTYSITKKNINNPNKPCWFDVVFTNLDASIYLSYKPVDSNLNKYIEESRMLAFKHTVKAFDIEQLIINYPEKDVYGLVYQIEGNAASAYQFHLTDNDKHFLRGSLYFNNIPNQDSIQPVLDFIKEDITHIFETFEWK
jgi:gliding motility-associated lipoprotein GldD